MSGGSRALFDVDRDVRNRTFVYTKKGVSSDPTSAARLLRSPRSLQCKLHPSLFLSSFCHPGSQSPLPALNSSLFKGGFTPGSAWVHSWWETMGKSKGCSHREAATRYHGYYLSLRLQLPLNYRLRKRKWWSSCHGFLYPWYPQNFTITQPSVSFYTTR